MQVFPWVQAFYPELSALDEKKTHTLEDFKNAYGEDYTTKIPQRYWIHYGGRAIDTFKKEYQMQDLEYIISQNGPCTELADTSHFHVDLYGRYIPGLCSGFSIECSDLGTALSQEKYPFINLLYEKGIKAFYEIALKEGFLADNRYLNKCHLCLEIRKYLVNIKKIESLELFPKEYYSQL
jgi:hypothetical protein